MFSFQVDVSAPSAPIVAASSSTSSFQVGHPAPAAAGLTTSFQVNLAAPSAPAPVAATFTSSFQVGLPAPPPPPLGSTASGSGSGFGSGSMLPPPLPMQVMTHAQLRRQFAVSFFSSNYNMFVTY
jgi:hypothetical protein